jgi:hypothetical protein
MKSGVYHKLVRMGRWQRFVTVLLLALAFVDITLIDAVSPQICNDGAESPAGFIVAGSNSDSTPASTDEDCFCCCSHIILDCAFNFGTLIPGVRLSIPSSEILPSPPSQDTFHPPRLA